MLAAALALLASLSWGTSDFLAGVQARRSHRVDGCLGRPKRAAALSLIALLAILAPTRPAWGVLAAPAVGGAIGGLGVLLQYRALALGGHERGLADNRQAPRSSRCCGEWPAVSAPAPCSCSALRSPSLASC